MNARLQLFFDNLDKINLYFGSDADKFGKDFAAKLTVRNIRFFYEDYENVQQQIKAHTKWYQLPRANFAISHAYYIHFAKTPKQVVNAIHMYKILTKKFNRGEQSYLTALHIRSHDQFTKCETLIHELMKQPSLRYSHLSTISCAVLTNRPEDTTTLAKTYERYYNELLEIGFKRSDDTKKAALLLTIGTGEFCEKIFDYVKSLTVFIQNTEIILRSCHYKTIALLALSKFEVAQFPALYDIHDEICRTLKLKSTHCDTLLLATQIYTSNEAIGNLSSHNLEFSDLAYSVIDGNFDDGGYRGGE